MQNILLFAYTLKVMSRNTESRSLSLSFSLFIIIPLIFLVSAGRSFSLSINNYSIFMYIYEHTLYSLTLNTYGE